MPARNRTLSKKNQANKKDKHLRGFVPLVSPKDRAFLKKSEVARKVAHSSSLLLSLSPTQILLLALSLLIIFLFNCLLYFLFFFLHS